jgi:hypothetical protein
VKPTTARKRRTAAVRPVRPVVLGPDGQPLTPAQAAALAMPPLSDEACAIVGRIFADIERRRAATAPQVGEVA